VQVEVVVPSKSQGINWCTHFEYFAGAQPAEPILRALRIEGGHEILRLTKIARRLDYLGADNPAVDAEFITRNIIEIDEVDSENGISSSEQKAQLDYHRPWTGLSCWVFSHVGVPKKFS
jgi:hypothetical protein